jgi:hypothetical protein
MVGGQADVPEQMPFHVLAVARRVARPHAEELVEVERRDASDIHRPATGLPDEFTIEPDRRPARRQAEDKVGLPPDGADHLVRKRCRAISGARKDPELHDSRPAYT